MIGIRKNGALQLYAQIIIVLVGKGVFCLKD